MLQQVELKRLLHYNSKTGIFTWKINQGHIKKGAIAGTLKNGYIRIGIDYNLYYAQRLAFFYITGTWPSTEVDHKDQCRNNNSWKNLRIVTSRENDQNRKQQSIYGCGVYKTKHCHFRARIRIKGKIINLGTYDTAKQAQCAYKKACNRHNA